MQLTFRQPSIEPAQAACSARMRQRFARTALFVLCAALTCGCTPRQSAPAELQFHVSLEPAQPAVGQATVLLSLTDASGVPVEGADVRVEGNMNHAGMKPSFAALQEQEPGKYSGTIEFTMGGDWFLLINATTSDGKRAEHKIDVLGVQTK
jgi:hypothetical protein